MSLTLRLNQFEGPLDLLLYLIQSQELDISTVSISQITDQYLNSIKLFQELNFDMASDFLLMAATLIMWKSKALLPDENSDKENTEDIALPLTQEDLVRQLQERQRFLTVAGEIATRPMLGDDVFTRPNKRPPVEKVWKAMNMTSLSTSLQDLLIREQRRARVVMKKETVSLSEKIKEFADRLTMNQITELKSMVRDINTRGEWVVSFLASLELSRLKKIKIYQEQAFDPIFIELVDKIVSFELSLAGSGFEYTQPNA